MQVRTWFGCFTLDDDRIIGVQMFKKDLCSIIERLIDEPLLLRGNVAGADIRNLAVEYGFVGSTDEYDRMLRYLNIELAREKIAQAATPDKHIIAAVEAIDDLNGTCNILAERLKEWYMRNFNATSLKSEELTRHIIGMKTQQNSFDRELKIMQSFASGLIGLYRTRTSIEEYLKENMHRTAPNLTNIAGYILGARLLSISGGLERLASMPSSTVQVIGANNALFRHLKGKASSPKHGLIFRHPFVNTAPRWQRGRIARALASKISLAARYDCYSGELKEVLLEELKIKVEYIKKHYPKPGQKS
jgi:nucleolar protein 56